MSTYETDRAFRQALERRLGKISDKRYASLTEGYHAPYGDDDLKEIVAVAGGLRRESHTKTLPEVVAAIAEELGLWQEARLTFVRAPLEEGRRRLFGTSEPLDQAHASTYLSSFLADQECIRPAYAFLLMERRIGAIDSGPCLREMQPNNQEYFCVMVALAMNAGFLSCGEAMWYALTGTRTVEPGLFNPATVMLAHRLLYYLQPPGRPARSLLSAKERALLRFTWPQEGARKAGDHWIAWNREHTEWRYGTWRGFWKAYQRAKTRLLDAYQFAMEYERRQVEDPDGFCHMLDEIGKMTRDGRQM